MTITIPYSSYLSGLASQLSTTFPDYGTLTSMPTAVRFDSAVNPRPAEEKEGGLSRSDKVALGVGLGVGMPTMIIALLTYLATYRRGKARRQKAKIEAEGQNKEGSDGSQTNLDSRIPSLTIGSEEMR